MSQRSRFLPYGRQTLDKKDINAVIKVLKKDYITQGPLITKFENAFSKYVGSKYAVSCSSGTAALHLSCLALGLKPGKKLVTSPISFVASANCGEFVGAKISFVDVDDKKFNLSTQKLEQKLKKEKIDVVVVIHMAGHPADLRKLRELKKKYKFKLIEDACHALGGKYKKSKIGSCDYSDICTFSFHPVKNITTGEGGMITTNDKKIYEKLKQLRSHGINKSSNQFLNRKLAFDYNGKKNMWYYEMGHLGFNYRLTDFQSALGISQLRKINNIIKKKRIIAKLYDKKLSNNNLISIPAHQSDIIHAYHLYTIMVDFKKLGKTRNQVMEELRKKSIGTQVLYIPIHYQPYYYNKYKYKIGSFPQSEKYYNNCLSIPIFPDLSRKEINHIIKTLLKVIN